MYICASPVLIALYFSVQNVLSDMTILLLLFLIRNSSGTEYGVSSYSDVAVSLVYSSAGTAYADYCLRNLKVFNLRMLS